MKSVRYWHAALLAIGCGEAGSEPSMEPDAGVPFQCAAEVGLSAASEARLAYDRGEDYRVVALSDDIAGCGQTFDMPVSFFGPIEWSPMGDSLSFTHEARHLMVLRLDPLKHLDAGKLGSVNPVWSPVSSQIAYSGDDGDLYVAWPELEDKRSVGSNVMGQEVWWSPDGQFIAFASEVMDVPTLFALRPSPTGELAPATLLQSEFTMRVAGWAPDGGHLLAQADQDIWVVPGIGSSVTMRKLSDGNARDASLSPDGTMAAFVRGDEPGETYLAPIDGSTQAVRVTQQPAYSGKPMWSPDGRYLLLRPAVGATDRPLVARIEAGEIVGRFILGPQQVLWVGEPAWSPDGRYLAIAVEDADAERVRPILFDMTGDEPGAPIDIRPDGPMFFGMAAEYVLAPNGPYIQHYFTWAADSSRVAFSAAVRDPQWNDVFAVPVNDAAGAIEPFASLDGSASAQFLRRDRSWHPERPWLMFGIFSGAGGSLWIADFEGSSPRVWQATDVDTIIHPTWSP